MRGGDDDDPAIIAAATLTGETILRLRALLEALSKKR